MRPASEAPFPYGWPGSVCYFVVQDGAPVQISGRDAMRNVVRLALAGETTIFAAWPGQYRTDLFVVDDVETLARALGMSLPAPTP